MIIEAAKLRYLRRILIYLIIFTLSIFISTHPAIAQDINNAVFNSADGSAFLEIYIKIPLSRLSMKKVKDKYRASVLINLILKQKDSIVYANKYFLESPKFDDTTNLKYALLDIKRIAILNEPYRLEVSTEDEYKPGSYKISNIFLSDKKFNTYLLNFSDIELADTIIPTKEINKFSRNQFDIIPNVHKIYYLGQNNLFFYVELYNVMNILKQQPVILKYYLSKDTVTLTEYGRLIKQNPQPVNCIYGKLDIKDLPDGMYNLNIEAYNMQNKQLLSKTTSFQRMKVNNFANDSNAVNPKNLFYSVFKEYNLIKLKEQLDYIYSKLDADELKKADSLKAKNDSVQLKNFLYGFWVKRYPKDPANGWYSYMKRIVECNKGFTTMFRKGYLTERGRVYLQYGPPNSIIEATDPAISYPYQIWHYYHLTATQQNKKFVFFNKTGALNEYELIWSNATGEVAYPNWKDMIRKYNTSLKKDSKTFGDFLDDDFNE